jgi:hypothetical protein
MTAALAWINDLVQWLGRWIPRLVLIHATHRGVKFGPRGRTTAVGPGLVCYWPITHDLLQVPVTMQSIHLCGQMLPCQEPGAVIPRVMICSLHVQFSIADPVTAATTVLYFPALVMNRVQAVAVRHWGTYAGDLGAWQGQIQREASGELAPYGIHINAVDVAGLGQGVVFKKVDDWSYSDTGKRG